MNLKEIVNKWNLNCSFPISDVEVLGITENSKKVQNGYIFVSIHGEHSNGFDYIPEAIEKGAINIIGTPSLSDELVSLLKEKQIPYFTHENPRRILGEVAHYLAGDPTKSMVVIGITGTNGKTTTTFLVESILKEAGIKVARFGTIGYDFGEEYVEAIHTTPFNEELVALFSKAREKRITHVVMEVSSHSLAQDRVAGIHFTAAAFTNLTQDHLDFHKTMETYLNAKLKLFEMLPPDGSFGVVNKSDPNSEHFIKQCKSKCITYGIKGDYWASDIEITIKDTKFQLHAPTGEIDIRLPLIGKHNVANALCASAIAGGLEIPLKEIQKGLKNVKPVPGRFELIDEGQEFAVVVDYAHTEDGLNNVLQTARSLTNGKVIVVFGCGGDRDKTKRPKMGAIAGKWANLIILTSDNPRTEDPKRILLDIEVGVQKIKEKGNDYFVIENREEAIQFALSKAKANDIVIIAGKGHEPYQIIGVQKFPFDDREVVRKFLKGK
ncbi:MAG TPA: UDP-N-acetylmuramoyl-L-alanyl-D-glutamate--2,6-diaminopimelate ligase [Candidatus Hydrogenedens sp.]|nr:UDP-N-acetylmuramoyl-L-alanyl-D-glutamate--2,6-diaminopimelate ligase [Candidatus Hydrogenedens sp.]